MRCVLEMRRRDDDSEVEVHHGLRTAQGLCTSRSIIIISVLGFNARPKSNETTVLIFMSYVDREDSHLLWWTAVSVGSEVRGTPLRFQSSVRSAISEIRASLCIHSSYIIIICRSKYSSRLTSVINVGLSNLVNYFHNAGATTYIMHSMRRPQS